ncbi:unnamed protein product [Phytophthora fragariaefolia]|uniref:Unnamed protein product n=1 Tax=Phytophthora fragariaefolia TaxID=1490495 RepID=A0A9W6YFG8_9STRA|nr:unnamed protein product [Phytophthora fragariaefolia]
MLPTLPIAHTTCAVAANLQRCIPSWLLTEDSVPCTILAVRLLVKETDTCSISSWGGAEGCGSIEVRYDRDAVITQRCGICGPATSQGQCPSISLLYYLSRGVEHLLAVGITFFMGDVARSLNLRTVDDEIMESFGEHCFSSRECYNGITSMTVAKETPVPLSEVDEILPVSSKSFAKAQFSTSEGEEDYRPNNRKPRTPRQPSSTSPSPTDYIAALAKRKRAGESRAKSAGKKKAKTFRRKVAVSLAGLKQELLRRAYVSAAKLINANVAFSPADEDWMPQTNYRDVGAAFLVGVIVSYEIQKTKNSEQIDIPIAVFEVRWTNTSFQKKNKNFITLLRLL